VPYWIPAALGLSVVLFVPGLLEQFEVPKTELIRVCGLACLAWAVAGGWPWRTKRTFLDFAVLVWLAAEGVATLASVSPRLSLFGEPEQREGLITSVSLVGFFAASRLAAPGPAPAQRSLQVLLQVVLWAAALSCLYALVQAADWDPIAWVGRPSFEGRTRPGSTFGHPNLLGVATAVLAAVAAAMAAAKPERRGAWLTLTGVLAVTNLLTLSRGAWLALIVAVPLAAALAWPPGSARRISGRTWLIGTCALALFFGSLFALGLAQPLLLRIQGLFAPLEGSGRSRVEIWRTALVAWHARPLIGQGPDTFFLVYPRFQTVEYWRQEWGLLPTQAHSIYLHTLATRGLVGAVAGALLVVAIAAAAWRAWSAGDRRLAAVTAGVLAAIGIGGLFGTAGIFSVTLVMTLAGLLAARAEIGEASGSPARAGLRAPAIAALLVGGIALYAAGRELMASHAAGLANLELMRDPRHAAELAADAERLMPFDDLYPSLVARSGLAIEPDASDVRARRAEAEAAAARALALAPRRAVHYETLGYLLANEAAMGDTTQMAAADSAFARALQLAPADGRMLQQLAELELAFGRPGRATWFAELAARLYPEEGSAWSIVAVTRMRRGDRDGAREALERAIAGRWHDDGSGRVRAGQALRALAGGG
jgi:O-antigen ligase